MESDAILCVQIVDIREVAELRWNGANEIIRIEGSEKATMNEYKRHPAIESDINC